MVMVMHGGSLGGGGGGGGRIPPFHMPVSRSCILSTCILPNSSLSFSLFLPVLYAPPVATPIFSLFPSFFQYSRMLIPLFSPSSRAPAFFILPCSPCSRGTGVRGRTWRTWRMLGTGRTMAQAHVRRTWRMLELAQN